MKKDLDLYKKYLKMCSGGEAKMASGGIVHNPFGFLGGLDIPMNVVGAPDKKPDDASSPPQMGKTSDSTDPNITGANNPLVTSGQATTMPVMAGGAGDQSPDSNPFLSTVDSMAGKGPEEKAYKGGKIKGYSDGGDVLSDLAEKFKQAFGTPKPAPSPGPSLDEKYQKIREQNRKNFENPGNQPLFEGGISGSTHKYQYSDGGEIDLSPVAKSRQAKEDAVSAHVATGDQNAILGFNTHVKPTMGAVKLADNLGESSNQSDSYSSGGKVEHDPKNLIELGKAFLKFLDEEKSEKMSSGGKVGSGERFAKLENKLSHQKGVTDPGALAASIGRKKYGKKKMQKMSEAHMYDGGTTLDPVKVAQYKKLYPGVSDDQVANMIASEHPAAPKAAIPGSEVMNQMPQNAPVDSGDLAGNINQQVAQMQVGQGMADGGVAGDVPQDPIYPDLTPEQEAQNAAELAQLKANGAKTENVEGDEQDITGALPADESDMEESEDPEDKSLDEEYANEDFKAGEKSDSSDRKPASEEQQVDDDSDEDEKKPAESDSAAGLQISPEIQKAITDLKKSPDDLTKAQKERDQNVLGQEMAKYGALAGAGLLGRPGINVSPNPALGVIGSNDKYAGLPVEKYQEQIANQQNDPNSNVSKLTKAYMKDKYKIDAPDNASYSDLSKIFPMIKSDQALQTRVQIAANTEAGRMDRNTASNESHEKVAKEKAAQTEKDLKIKQDTLKMQKQQQQDAKTASDQGKALQNTQQMLESARGNPAAAQAEKDLYSVQKANSLINMYGDPNKLSPQQVNLLVSEVSKIATGGVPTGHEQEALKPGTAESHLASLWSKLSNEPTPANAGAFIKQFQDYNNALAKDAQKVIQDKYGRVIETRKKQLGDDNYQSLQDNYINRFKPASSDIPVDADLTKLSPKELKDYIKLHGPQ